MNVLHATRIRLSGETFAHSGTVTWLSPAAHTARNSATHEVFPMKPSVCETTLDLRGLDPPEPLERVLDALGSLQRDRYLHMVIDREPVPLYGILKRNGFEYSVDVMVDGCREICIWQEQ